MTRLLWFLPVFLLTACESLPFTQAKNQIESLVTAYAAGTYTVTFTKDGRTLYTEQWTCVPRTDQLPACTRVTAVTKSTDVVPVK